MNYEFLRNDQLDDRPWRCAEQRREVREGAAGLRLLRGTWRTSIPPSIPMPAWTASGLSLIFGPVDLSDHRHGPVMAMPSLHGSLMHPFGQTS
jgi:hypothetical protein